jgi:hypothetical protein
MDEVAGEEDVQEDVQVQDVQVQEEEVQDEEVQDEEVQDEEVKYGEMQNNRTESGVPPPIAPDTSSTQPSQSSAFSTDFEPNLPQFYTSNSADRLHSSFNQTTDWPFDTTSLDQLDHTADTLLIDPALEDWLLLASNTSPDFPLAESPGQRARRENNTTTNPSSPT